MSSFDLVQDLPAALADRAAAWAYIRGFAETWRTPLSPGDGTPEAELTAAEEALAVRLPVAAREAYTLFGRRFDLHSNMQHLLSPGEFYVDDRKEALVFREENQGVASWGVLLSDLDQADPPVRMRGDLADKDAERWEPWLGSFSVSCIEIVLTEAVLADDALCDSGDYEDGDELDRRFTRLPFPGYPEGEPGPAFYAGSGVLIWDTDGWLCVRAQDEEALDRLRATLDADWLT
ncbi:SMI1/KNR4 family protein [Actinomadura darangshiensis]|uniref:SMI1/KNR4 family protein n=1 Tax=Actinomadura darangshiensis TaxID=705336 RepID=A0A4R5B6B2_9ACTN|nr:SMI1/KNR4 family protein [Actinomadura darangshiensis]TDD79184.1 SMI1/KNR4 family protein [Actinomadura darangshiensis]